jgi:hypothetical protein
LGLSIFADRETADERNINVTSGRVEAFLGSPFCCGGEIRVWRRPSGIPRHLLGTGFAHALVSCRIPDFAAVERSADDDFRVEVESRIRAEFFVDIDAALCVNRHFNCIRSQGPLLCATHLTAPNFFHCIFGNALEGFGGQHIDALVGTQRQVTPRFQSWSKCSGQRNTTLWIKLSLVYSDEHVMSPFPT